MKKSILIKSLMSLAVCAVSLVGFAQKEKVIKVFSNGNVIAEYNANNIDYIRVDDLINAPEDMVADVEGNAITIKWMAVEGATYNVFRSADNVNFTLIAKDLKENTYTDHAPLTGTNFYKVKAVVNGQESAYTTSATATLTDNGMESGIYLGIIGFNSSLYEHPINLLNETTVEGYYNFIDELQSKDMTLLYHSVEKALDKMQSTTYPTDLSRVALVTFTDGLDRGSHGKTDVYIDSEDGDLDYRNDLNNRIKNQTIAGKDISAYCIGIRGDDVTDYSKFKDNIKKLSSSDENAYEVTDMSQVNAKFKVIAEELTKSTIIQSFTAKIPPEANGSLIRITFDNVKTKAEDSRVWIQGNLNLRTKTLENINYEGLKFLYPVSSVNGTVDEEGFYCYTFEGIITTNNLIFSPEATMEYIYIKSTSSWQPNKEFGNTGNFVPKIDKSSAAIMLILDCTSSLGDMFDKSADNAKSNAKNFVKTLYDASVADPETPDTPPSFGDKSSYTVNGVSFNMIKVNGGSYMMGMDGFEEDEKPMHIENIESFNIGETEVTQGLWKAVMGTNPSNSNGNEQLPVENVSWDDCQVFIDKLNKMTGCQFRLPTEAEWEYAARGGELSKGYKYSGGNNLADVAWYIDNCNSETHLVAKKQPNELGIYDMTGNVWEWTSDKYSTDYSSTRNSNERVYRGGSKYSLPFDCRIANRSSNSPEKRNSSVGLRLAL